MGDCCSSAASESSLRGEQGCSHKCTVAKSRSSRLPTKSTPLVPLTIQDELAPPSVRQPSSPLVICKHLDILALHESPTFLEIMQPPHGSAGFRMSSRHAKIHHLHHHLKVLLKHPQHREAFMVIALSCKAPHGVSAGVPCPHPLLIYRPLMQRGHVCSKGGSPCGLCRQCVWWQ